MQGRVERNLTGGDASTDGLVVHDTDRSAQVDQHGRPPGLGHRRCGVAYPRVGRAPQRSADERADRSLQPVRGSTGGNQSRARDERPVVGEGQSLRVRDEPARIRQQVAQGVLGGAHRQRRREAREHRDVAERVARAEDVDDASPVDDLHRPGAHDIEVRQRRRTLGHDHHAVGEELDLDLAGELVEVPAVQLVVRELGAQELHELAHGTILTRVGRLARTSCDDAGSALGGAARNGRPSGRHRLAPASAA